MRGESATIFTFITLSAALVCCNGGRSPTSIPEETWRCPQIEDHPAVECSCDLPHTLRCTGDRSAMQIIGRTLRSLPTHRAVSLLDCTVQNVSALAGPLLEGVALHGLVVSSGEIRDVHSAAFRGLASPLQALGLPNNQLTKVPTEALSQLLGLDRLDLSHNKLKSIENDSFVGLSNLTFLELSENQLSYLAPKCFRPLKLLMTLRLRGNSLQSMSLIVLSDLTSLVELDLSANAIAGPIGPNLIPTLHNLRLLNLGFNSLTSVKRGALAGLTNLTSLSLHHNQIDVVEDYAFRLISKLTELDLAHNGIVAVSGSSLANLPLLQKLELSHNFLRALTADLVGSLIGLRELRLDDNDISIVATDAFKSGVVLDRLTLSDNPLNCDCSLSDFATWLRTDVHLSTLDRDSAICATPPSLEGAPLRALPPRKLSCDSSDDYTTTTEEAFDDLDTIDVEASEREDADNDMDGESSEADIEADDETKVSKDQVTLSEFQYDGALVRLRWQVDAKVAPFSCDAVFVYEESREKETLVSSEPIHCDSKSLKDSTDLHVTVPGSRDLVRNHRYRYCLILLQGSKESDELALALGCSEVIPLHSASGTTGENVPRKEPAVRVSGVRSNFTTEGTLSIELSLIGYPPERPHNLQLLNGEQEPSPKQITDYFDALNNCYVSLAVFAQGSMIAQRDTQCDRTFVKMEGFMQGPYRVCASLSEFQVTGPSSRCVTAVKIGKTTNAPMQSKTSAVGGLNVAAGVAGVGLLMAVIALLWASRRLLKRPKFVTPTHQCFRPDPQACDDVQHSGYVKLHATTKL